MRHHSRPDCTRRCITLSLGLIALSSATSVAQTAPGGPTIGPSLSDTVIGVHPPSPAPRYRYPAPLGPSDRTFWTVSAGTLVGAALLDHPARNTIRGYRTPFLDRIAPLGDVFGTAKYTVPTVTAALVAAHLSRNPNWEDGTRHITFSYVLGDVTEALIKGGVGRQRPSYTGSAWRFRPLSLSDEWHSFPSGHVTHITAIAAALAEEAHRPWVTVLCAGAVALTGWQRIYRDQHWASDVVGGTIVGVAASRVTVHWFRHKRETGS